MNPEEFCNAIREADEYNEVLYLQGSCYRFFKLLKKFYPNAVCWIDKNQEHVITEIDGLFYDITGKVNLLEYGMEYSEFRKATDNDIRIAENWGFGRHKLMIGEDCPNCGEEILIETTGNLVY